MADFIQNKTCNTAYEELVGEIARREFGRDVTLLAVPTYPDSIVYELTAAGGGWIFKAPDPDGRDRDAVAIEAWAYEKARGAGVPTPQIHSLDTSRSRFPSSYLLMEKAKGECLERLALPRPELEPALEELGSLMGMLHTIEIPSYGLLDEERFRATGVARGSASTWVDALFGRIPESMEYLDRAGALSAHEIDEIRVLIPRLMQVVETRPASRLLHGDLGLVHVWFDPEAERISAWIDFGECMSGDPVYDFCDLDLDAEWLGHVVAGYYEGTTPPEDFDHRVWLYAFVRSIPWAAKWHVRGHIQVIDWVRHLLRAAPQAFH
jgi:aminoglycoside phosphotransferase (APT) family kinase protein